MSKLIQVTKNNGQTVTFDKNKISNILLKVGIAQSEAEQIANQVEAWADEKHTVTAQEIKQEVLRIVPRDVALKIRDFVKQRRG